jgi:hypothetical protein
MSCCFAGGPALAPDGSAILEEDKGVEFQAIEDRYCKNNEGDWRYTPCDSEFAIYTNGSIPVF